MGNGNGYAKYKGCEVLVKGVLPTPETIRGALELALGQVPRGKPTGIAVNCEDGDELRAAWLRVNADKAFKRRILFVDPDVDLTGKRIFVTKS